MSILDRVMAAGKAAYAALVPVTPATPARRAPGTIPGVEPIRSIFDMLIDGFRPGVAPDGRLAPWPMTDKYPIVLGSSITLATISSHMRMAQTGHRQPFVDLLDELLEREPHGYAVLQQRILTVAGGRLDISPPKLTLDTEQEHVRAMQIAREIQATLAAIPDFKQSMASLLWGLYYGVAAAEITWSNDGGFWRPAKLEFVHSRRLAFPDPLSWDLHIWDQGVVGPFVSPTQSTSRIWGLRIKDYPGKFIVHAPQLRGDYPTRDGLGHELAYWFALKGMVARNASQYIERFSKPWPIATWVTQDEGKPRAANDDDILKADAAMRALGAGSLAAATLPDSISVKLFGPGQQGSKIALTHDAFIALINAEISKAVQGQTFTTETGKFGSRSTADVGQSNAMRLGAYDAACLAETVRRDLVYYIMRLNYPDEMRFMPEVAIHVEDEPDVSELIARAQKACMAGLPIDAEEFGVMVGLPLVPREKGDNRPRRLVPLSQVDLFQIDPGARHPDAEDIAPNNPLGKPDQPAPTEGDELDEAAQ